MAMLETMKVMLFFKPSIMLPPIMGLAAAPPFTCPTRGASRVS